MQFAGWLATCAMGSCVQQDSSCVEQASWLLPMLFWLEANRIFLRTSHIFSLSSSSGLPTLFHYHHPFTSTAANHCSTGNAARCEWNRIEQNDGCFIDTPPTETQLQPRHHLAHRELSNAAIENMTLDAQFQIARRTGSSRNMKPHAIGCKCICIEVHSRQLKI